MASATYLLSSTIDAVEVISLAVETPMWWVPGLTTGLLHSKLVFASIAMLLTASSGARANSVGMELIH